jgi:xylulokinase
MTRAVLEGVAFGLKDGLDLMIEAGTSAPDEIRASGGGTRSRLWRQILADVLQTEIALAPTEEGAAYGAALLAAVGAGWSESVEEATEKVIRVEPAASPSSDVALYAETHQRYRRLYPALKAV